MSPDEEPKPKVEPTADLRQMAKFMRQAYIAFKDEGFSSTEALEIISMAMRAGGQNNG